MRKSLISLCLKKVLIGHSHRVFSRVRRIGLWDNEGLQGKAYLFAHLSTLASSTNHLIEPGTALPQLTLFYCLSDSTLPTGMGLMITSSLCGDILQRSRKMAMRRKRFQMQPLSLMPALWSICLLR